MNQANDYELIKIKEKINDVIYGVIPYYITPFMSLPYQLEINNICKRNDLKIRYFNDGERKVALIGKCEEENVKPICILEIITHETLKYNEIMGALLNIGIKRELTGNISVKDNIYLIEVLDHIAPFVKENFNYVSHHKIKVVETNKIMPKEEHVIKNVIASSLRLDNVVSAVFNMSREQAKEAILNEEVAYNFETKLRVDQKVQQHSYLSCHHKGKVIILEEIARTRKDNIVFEVEYFK